MPKHKPHFLQNVVQYPHAIGTPMCSHICGVIGTGEQPPPTSCMFPQLLKALMASCFKSGKDRGEFHFRSGNFCEPTLFYRVFTRTFYCIRHICEFDSVLRRCNIIHANNIFFSNPRFVHCFFSLSHWRPNGNFHSCGSGAAQQTQRPLGFLFASGIDIDVRPALISRAQFQRTARNERCDCWETCWPCISSELRWFWTTRWDMPCSFVSALFLLVVYVFGT